jgi:hypothetical protein
VLSPCACSKRVCCLFVCMYVGPRLACAGTVLKSDSTKSVQRNFCYAVKRLQLLGKKFYQLFLLILMILSMVIDYTLFTLSVTL